jgi:hypothetical protein
MPHHRRSGLLRRTLLSIQADRPSFEVVIVNDDRDDDRLAASPRGIYRFGANPEGPGTDSPQAPGWLPSPAAILVPFLTAIDSTALFGGAPVSKCCDCLMAPNPRRLPLSWTRDDSPRFAGRLRIHHSETLNGLDRVAEMLFQQAQGLLRLVAPNRLQQPAVLLTTLIE